MVTEVEQLTLMPPLIWAFNLEKAVETTDCTADADQQGLGLGSLHTCEVSARPGWKPSFQPCPSVESVKSVVKTTAAFRFKA